ncbi:MAG: TIGR01906 family membrane protein [Defluviitaleaceae bacterium]|nr:TIGR01906 family membrane protein [Defluviitaleaceae bacterium]
MKWFLIILNTICLATLIVLTAVELPVFYRPLYKFEYDKYNIPVQLNMTSDDLAKVTDHMLDYMSGKVPDLSIITVVDGQTRDFFDAREKEHMADVRRLFLDGFMIRNIAAGGFVVTLILLFALRYRPMRSLTLVYQIFLGSMLVILALAAYLISRNFDAAWTIFHHIFFRNNLWLLDPSVDLLVDIVPDVFFEDLAMIIGILYASLSLLVMIASAIIHMILGARVPPRRRPVPANWEE